MAYDLDLMRKKLAKANGGGDTYKPQNDDIIRVLNIDPNDKDPFKEYYQHYNLGQTFVCMNRTYQGSGKKCPVCEFTAKKKWSEYTKEEQDFVKTLFAKERYYSYVLVRGAEKDGVKVWSYGIKVYKVLLGLVLDDDYGDITDLKVGRDIKLTVAKARGKDGSVQKYDDVTLTVKPNISPCKPSGMEQSVFDSLLAKPAITIQGIMKELTYDQAAQVLQDKLLADVGGSNNSEEEKVEENKYEEPKTKSEVVRKAEEKLARLEGTKQADAPPAEEKISEDELQF